MNLNNGAQLIIESGATFTDQAPIGNGFADQLSGSGPAAAVTNDGAYTKTGAGTTVSTINVAFNNSGTVSHIPFMSTSQAARSTLPVAAPTAG